MPPRNEISDSHEFLEYMRCLEPQSSVPNTRAPSPDRSFSPPPPTRYHDWSQHHGSVHLPPLPGYSDVAENAAPDDDGEDSQPRKKQKTTSVKVEEDDDDEVVNALELENHQRGRSRSYDDLVGGEEETAIIEESPDGSWGTPPATTTAATRMIRRGSQNSSASGGSAASSSTTNTTITTSRRGRRASSSSRKSSSKQSTRENLSEEQKRTNHILSEQKRRNLIRQGFEDLCSLVPSLRGGGFSKSAMLIQTADWLEEVVRGNEVLKGRLEVLKSSSSAAAAAAGSLVV